MVIAGYDVGSRVAQQVAADRPGAVRALVLTPPLPGVGARVLDADAQREFWYQHLHRLDLAERLIDGNREAVRTYVEHFWSHWSGEGYEPDGSALDRLAQAYGEPGAFVASIGWYRGRGGSVARALVEQAPAPEDRLATPTTILWPRQDPLFPIEWSDRLDEFLGDFTLSELSGSGHFVPLEAPQAMAEAILAAV